MGARGGHHDLRAERHPGAQPDGLPHTYYVVADGQSLLVHNKKKRKCPQWVRDLREKGNEFNRKREPHYKRLGGANEVAVGPKTKKGSRLRVDSYIPGKEIVSRKYTDLNKISPKTAKKYLNELATKYKPGTKIPATKGNKEKLSEKQIKDGLQGDMVLEVPAQKNGVPQEILDEAERLDITIRDETGKVYN